jgi:hypothetical protein
MTGTLEHWNTPQGGERDPKVIPKQTTRNNTNLPDFQDRRERGGRLERSSRSSVPVASVLVADLIEELSAPPEPLDHYCCCDDIPGTVASTLCGIREPVEFEEVEAVSCVVCTDLWAHRHCPRYGTCHGGTK